MLNIKDGAQSKSYLTTSQCDKPRLCVDNGGYIPLTTNTISGIQIKNRINGQTYRPMEYKSSSTIDTFYTSAAESIGLSSTTALTRESISGYATRASTSATLTRASTSATLTRASTSATLTRASTSATLTRASTSATLTRASTSATLTRASTSATLTRSSISGYGTKTNAKSAYMASYEAVDYNTRDRRNGTSTSWTMNLENAITSSNYQANRYYTVRQAGSNTLVTQSSTTKYYSDGSTKSATVGHIMPNATTSLYIYDIISAYGVTKLEYKESSQYLSSISENMFSYTTIRRFGTQAYNSTLFQRTQIILMPAYTQTITTATLTRSSVSGYGTRSSISSYGTRSSVSGYGTRSSVSGYGTRSSVSGYGTRSSISGYATRSSISGYETRISTSATLTCESTSGYSGISSSSSSTEVWQ